MASQSFCTALPSRSESATQVLGPEEDEASVEAKDGARLVRLVGRRRDASLGARGGNGAGGAARARSGSCGGGLHQHPSRKVTYPSR